MKEIIFRTDASLQIGTGHVMRCLTLADALQAVGARCHFICREHPGNLIEQIRQRGFAVSVLPAAGSEEAIPDSLADVKQPGYATWLGVDWTTDAAQTKAGLGGTVVDWLIVDHYSLDARWGQALRPMCRKLMVIDDLANRPHDCDVLLDQNFFLDGCRRYNGLVPPSCTRLLGPQYALLRKEFRFLRARTKPRTGQVKGLLVFLGGVDAGNYTGMVLEALKGLAGKKLQVDVVIGAQHPCRAAIEVASEAQGYVCHVQTARMAELMVAADLAIGAGGSATWERCCLGLPAVLIALADNQINIAKGVDFLGAGVYLGTSANVDVETMRSAIMWIVGNVNRFNRLSTKAFSLVDGLGVKRVSQVLEV